MLTPLVLVFSTTVGGLFLPVRLPSTDWHLRIIRSLKRQCGGVIRHRRARRGRRLRVIKLCLCVFGSWHAAPPGPIRDPHPSRIDQIRLCVRQWPVRTTKKPKMNRSVPEPAEAYKTIQQNFRSSPSGIHTSFWYRWNQPSQLQTIKLPQDPTSVRARCGLPYCDILSTKTRYSGPSLS